MNRRHFNARTGLAIVIANMIGTGVFTSLGFQLVDIQSGFALLMLWVIGGVAALCGALCYAELGATFPRSGGEYNFLTQTMHPAAGFVSGWVSATVGFAAPTALAAITFGKYLAAVWPAIPVRIVACILVAGLGLIHAGRRLRSAGVQRWFTLIKVILIAAFCVAIWLLGDIVQATRFVPAADDWSTMTSGAFAVALIYVNYAYTGWNAATYISGELDDPQRSLGWILGGGTALVMVLYLALNASFLLAASAEQMRGQVEVGAIAASAAFGPIGGKLMGGMLALLLISTVSAMLLAGPRVLQMIGTDFPLFGWLAVTNQDGLPSRAVGVQTGLAIGFIVSGTFESILLFAGFILALNTFLTVGGLLWVRWRRPTLPRPFASPLFPLPAVVYLMITGWTMWFVLQREPLEAWLGLIVIGVGLVFYLLVNRGVR